MADEEDAEVKPTESADREDDSYKDEFKDVQPEEDVELSNIVPEEDEERTNGPGADDDLSNKVIDDVSPVLEPSLEDSQQFERFAEDAEDNQEEEEEEQSYGGWKETLDTDGINDQEYEVEEVSQEPFRETSEETAEWQNARPASVTKVKAGSKSTTFLEEGERRTPSIKLEATGSDTTGSEFQYVSKSPSALRNERLMTELPNVKSGSGIFPPAPPPPKPSLMETAPNVNMPMNIVWSFGMNRTVPCLNLTDDQRRIVMYPCSHIGVMYDFEKNKQHILQGHSNMISCTCVSENKQWLVTADKGPDSMIICWDTNTGIPIQTIFDPNPDGGFVCLALSSDARYLATLSSTKPQIFAVWDWTQDGETPIVSADLDTKCGLQNHICFNPQNPHFIVTNSETQVVFYHWAKDTIEYFAPSLTDEDFNKPVGRYSQSIFLLDCPRALTATSIGNMVVWDNNKLLPKDAQDKEDFLPLSSDMLKPNADKKASKIIKMQDHSITVLTTSGRFVVFGDSIGHVKFFDQNLKLLYWYQDFHLGPIQSVSFGYYANFHPFPREGSKYPSNTTIPGDAFVVRSFVIGTAHSIIAAVETDGGRVTLIHREHERSVHCMAAHPTMPIIAIGSYAGYLKIWNFETKEVVASRQFDKNVLIECCAFDSKGRYLGLGFTNGQTRILDATTLNDEHPEPFKYARDSIDLIAFSHDSQYLATADGEHTTSVYVKRTDQDGGPFIHLGRYRAHYRAIKSILFGVYLDCNQPRLLTLGEDRLLVEYDLSQNPEEGLKIFSTDRIEQSAIPLCMTWYPPISKEHFIVMSNDQFKFKLFNATTKMCRKTVLAPTYGSPVERIVLIPSKDIQTQRQYLAFATADRVGLQILPLTGNPHNSVALIAHPGGIEKYYYKHYQGPQVANIACSYDGKFLFTAGGSDCAVHMWRLNFDNLEAQAKLGGEDLIPFYGLLDGGRQGQLFKELEDYFYYSQIRSQGANAMNTRKISTKIPLSEVPFVMRALGFYPSEQEIEDMMNEVKFSEYVNTGKYVEEIDLGDFIKLYVNHRPAFGLSREKLEWAFEVLGYQMKEGAPAYIDRGDFLDFLQMKGEHMTENELAEHLTTLLGCNAEGGTCELPEFDSKGTDDIIDKFLPRKMDVDMFCENLLGFSFRGNSTSTLTAELEKP